MNTPAHLLINLTLLTRRRQRIASATAPASEAEQPMRFAGWITAGSVLPDLPMLLFYLWQRVVIRLPERQIWGEAYFRDSWQGFFDVFNSIPLAALGLLVAYGTGRRAWLLFCASLLLHSALDLPLHHDDAHGHFFPFTTWRFESSVSYWDPQHHGHLGAGAEVFLVWLSAALLWTRVESRWARAALAGLSLFYAVGYGAFYLR